MTRSDTASRSWMLRFPNYAVNLLFLLPLFAWVGASNPKPIVRGKRPVRSRDVARMGITIYRHENLSPLAKWMRGKVIRTRGLENTFRPQRRLQTLVSIGLHTNRDTLKSHCRPVDIVHSNHLPLAGLYRPSSEERSVNFGAAPQVQSVSARPSRTVIPEQSRCGNSPEPQWRHCGPSRCVGLYERP